MRNATRWSQITVAGLLVLQCLQIVITIHRESLTWDEGTIGPPSCRLRNWIPSGVTLSSLRTA